MGSNHMRLNNPPHCISNRIKLHFFVSFTWTSQFYSHDWSRLLLIQIGRAHTFCQIRSSFPCSQLSNPAAACGPHGFAVTLHLSRRLWTCGLWVQSYYAYYTCEWYECVRVCSLFTLLFQCKHLDEWKLYILLYMDPHFHWCILVDCITLLWML